MPAIRKLSGTWRGRLVDIQGFEGELELSLRSEGDGRLRGTFRVELGGTHSTIRQRGEVRGSFSEAGLKLDLAGKELPVKINLAGDVLELKDGGIGLRGVYQVSARTYSPLQGGIVCAAKDQKVEVDIASRRQPC